MAADTKDSLNWVVHAPGCCTLQKEDGTASWVFGVRWLPTVDLKSRKLLLRQLRREKVKWWVCPSSKARTIGFLPELHDSGKAHRRPALLSAALMFALEHPEGTHLLKATFSSDVIWVVAVSDGQVLSQTDRLFECDAQAGELQESIRKRFAQSLGLDMEMSVQPGCLREALPFLYEQKNASQVLVKPLKKSSSKRLLALLLLAAIAILALESWNKTQGQGKAAVANRNLSAGTGLSEQVLHLALSDLSVLQTMATVWMDLPVRLNGWRLKSSHCQMKQSQAVCSASYERQSSSSSNLSFQGLERHGWKMQPLSLDRTEIVKTVPLQVKQVRVRDLPLGMTDIHGETGTSDGGWLVRLQMASASLGAIELSQPVSIPGQTGKYSRRSLRLAFPLRHLSTVQSLALPVLWTGAFLEIRSLSSVSPGWSVLQVQLEGVVYEQS